MNADDLYGQLNHAKLGSTRDRNHYDRKIDRLKTRPLGFYV